MQNRIDDRAAPTESIDLWDPQIETLKEEVARLRQALELQANLANREAQDTLRELEQRWLDARARLQRVEARAGAQIDAVREDVVSRLEDLRRRYWALRDRMQATKS